jgi:polysaccharide biosynthesis/export protein
MGVAAGDAFANTRSIASMNLFLPLVLAAAVAFGQSPALTNRTAAGGAVPVKLPPGYVIGVEDLLAISFWRDKDLSAEVVVRPDGRISLPLLNDVQAAGLTPEELRNRVQELARALVEDPTPTVVVKEIHSRQAFITGNVQKPGAYPLNTPITVMQLIATAGGLREFVAGKNIVVLRRDAGRDVRLSFDYQAVMKGRHLQQNVELRPGDTVIVP